MTDTSSSTTAHDDHQIGLRNLQQLTGKNFWVPGYQRGYRWDETQVKNLLEDIQGFQPEEAGSYYCLQPLVIKPSGNEWEVIDGQQRLTTLALILSCLKGGPKITITYETRQETSGSFLSSPNEAEASKNIDFYFMHRAHVAINDWLKEKRDEAKSFRYKLLNQVKVIWYPVDAGENSITIFTRINVGKIPLTDAELIRALFLKSNRLRRQEIALEWDAMEKALQSDAFWLFLNPLSAKPENRISLLFEWATPPGAAGEDHRVFKDYFQRLNNANAHELEVWKEPRRVFLQIEAWYQDRTLYHLIGYLIAVGFNPRDLRILEAESQTKSAFLTRLKQKIRENLGLNGDIEAYVGSLVYEKRQQVFNTLLLFNVASVLQNIGSSQRFDFAAFKSDEWDIEHVHSQTSPAPKGETEQRDWLTKVKPFIPQSYDLDDMLKSEPWNDKAFRDLYDKLLNEYEEDQGDKDEHLIGNLTLLDRETNRSYKNAIFPAKRGRILELEQKGKFVPPVTRNLFLKAYSKVVTSPLKWSAMNRDDHRKRIIEALKAFFS